MAEDGDGQPFQVRHEWSPEAISKDCNAQVNRERLTPIVPGSSGGEGRLWIPAASMSLGVCASSNGWACVKQAACMATTAAESNEDFMIYGTRLDKDVPTMLLIGWYPRQDLRK